MKLDIAMNSGISNLLFFLLKLPTDLLSTAFNGWPLYTHNL